MLARHAMQLYWIGRYLERAEDTTRLIDATQHGVLEVAVAARPPREMWEELFEVLFLEEDVDRIEGQPTSMLRLLMSDTSYPGSVASSVIRARENARVSREWLSTEVWEAINTLHLSLASTDLDAAVSERIYSLLQQVKSGCQSIVGAAQASMPRGDGFRFYQIGQRMERALITIRVLHVWHRKLGGFLTTAAFAEWVRLLRSLSAFEGYLRAHRAAIDGGRVLQYLMVDPHFPRSLVRSLIVAEDHLVEVASEDVGQASRRMAGRLRARIEFAEPAAMESADLSALLADVEDDLVALASQIEFDYFRPGSHAWMHSYEAV